jgi:hypothetical protein
LSGSALPEYEIDGKNVWDLISGEKDAVNPHDYYAFTTGKNFEAIMSSDGQWKLHHPHKYRTVETPGKDGLQGRFGTENIELTLYNLNDDPYEEHNVINEFPEVKEMLLELAEKHKQKFY